VKGSRKKQQPRSPKKRLYYVDNPNIKELSMLGSSPKSSGSQTEESNEAGVAIVQALQLSEVGTAETVTSELFSAPIVQPEPVVEVQLQKQADNLPETVWFAPEVAPEKERFQPVYTDDLSDGAVTGVKIAPRAIDGSR